MKKRTIWIGGLVVLALIAMFPTVDVSAMCKGDQCMSCVGLTCTESPSAGHCVCYDGESQGGRWCSVGGGSCTVIY